MFGLRLFSGWSPEPAAKPRATLAMESLEGREVPAVFSAFNAAAGQLTVAVDNNVAGGQNVFVRQQNGVVYVNDRPVLGPGGRAVASSAVRGITVIGSDLNNQINLSGVTTAGFLNLDGRVDVNARGGDDLVSGTQFSDRIDGGNGNDRLNAGRGNDTLAGGNGNDALVGGGGTFRDVFIGGSGRDQIFGYNARLHTILSGVEVY